MFQCMTDILCVLYIYNFVGLSAGFIMTVSVICLEMVCDNLSKPIFSYLSDRSQYVTLNNFKSNSDTITSVVPQGSHLAINCVNESF